MTGPVLWLLVSANPQHLYPLLWAAAFGKTPGITNTAAPVQTSLVVCFLGVFVAIAIDHKRKHKGKKQPPWKPALLCFSEVNINVSDIF